MSENTRTPIDPQLEYAEAMARLCEAVRASLAQGNIDFAGFATNNHARHVEMDALLELLTDTGAFTKAEFYACAAGKARLRANKIQHGGIVITAQRMNGRKV